MRPPIPDIAIPPMPPKLEWTGIDGAKPNVDRLVALGPVLVHFFDFAQLNSARTLPYLREWHGRYADAGLTVIGVHSPRHPCTAPAEVVAEAAERLGISYPVAIDSRFGVWRAYGCERWPSLFLWAQGGALRWFHFGEGEYAATEEAIQEVVLESRPDARLPAPMAPLRATDEPGALVAPPSEELLPGGSESEPWEPTASAPRLELAYEAGGAFLTADGEGEIEAAVDGGEPERIPVLHPGLYELTAHERSERHRLVIAPSPGVRVWSVSYAAGTP
jgi:hypothetical protein